MKRLLKYGILSALIFFPGFSGAVTITNHFELTNGTWSGAVSNCQSKGPGWDLTYAAGGNWYWVDQSNLTGWVKDAPSALTDHKCGYDATWPEDSKGAIVDGTSYYPNACAADMPKNNSFPGICLGQKCTYASSYGAWGACNSATGLQTATAPVYSTVYGPTCTDVVAPIRACGVCNATTVATPTSTSPTNLCSFGAPTVPIRSGANWVWSCNMTTGINASCAAPYVAPPTMTTVDAVCEPDGMHATISWSGLNLSTYAVRYNNGINPWHPDSCTQINTGDVCQSTTATSMRVNTTPNTLNALWVHAFGGSTWSAAMVKEFACPSPGPVVSLSVPADALTNLNNNSATVSQKDATFTWTINDPGVCGAGGCTCVFTGPDGDSIEKPYNSSDITSRTHTIWSKEAGSHTANVLCTSASGAPSNNPSATVSGSCNVYSYSTICNKECGDESSTTKRVETNCTTTTVSTDSCNHPACPVSGEWREVSN